MAKLDVDKVVRMKMHRGEFAVPPRTVGIIVAIDYLRGEYNHEIKWSRRIGSAPHQVTWVPERMLDVEEE
jgi:hypothetical protein